MEDIRKKADKFLLGLKGFICSLDRLEKDASVKIDRIQAERNEHIAPIKEGIALLDKELRKLAKGNKAELFEGRDRVDLEYGALLYTIEKRPDEQLKKVGTERIEEERFEKAMKSFNPQITQISQIDGGQMTKEDPKTESMADIVEMSCGKCDEMHSVFCLHRCIYKVLFDDCRTQE